MENIDFCIIGPGRLGSALAISLKNAGWTFKGACGRSMGSASELCDKAGAGTATINPPELAALCDLVFITTPDDVIENVCAEIADKKGFLKGSVVAHCSGAMTSHVLREAAKSGAGTGSIHPLQTFAGTENDACNLDGAFCCLEGTEDALVVLEKTASLLGMHAFRVKSGKKPLYHAGAVMASNFMIALHDIAVELERAAGVPGQIAEEALIPILESTLSNIKKKGRGKSLTGPFARGDTKTVKLHMLQMAKLCPGALAPYKALGLKAVELGIRQGELGQKKASALKKLLLGFKIPQEK